MGRELTAAHGYSSRFEHVDMMPASDGKDLLLRQSSVREHADLYNNPVSLREFSLLCQERSANPPETGYDPKFLA